MSLKHLKKTNGTTSPQMEAVHSSASAFANKRPAIRGEGGEDGVRGVRGVRTG